MCCCCKGCAKILLIIANAIYLLSGIMMFGFGIMARVKPDEALVALKREIPVLAEASEAFDTRKLISISGIVMIVLGIIIIAVAVFGCAGAYLEHRTLLIAYMAVVGVFLLTELALIIFVSVAPEKLKNTIRGEMLVSLGKVKEDVQLFPNKTIGMPFDLISSGWAFLQFKGSCCGVHNYTDFRSFTHNVSISGGIPTTTIIPISCCKKKKEVFLETSTTYDAGTFSNLNECLNGNKFYINDDNCYDYVYDQIKILRPIGTGYIFGYFWQQVFLIILAAILMRQNSKATPV